MYTLRLNQYRISGPIKCDNCAVSFLIDIQGLYNSIKSLFLVILAFLALSSCAFFVQFKYFIGLSAFSASYALGWYEFYAFDISNW